MASNEELRSHHNHKGSFMLPLAGVFLSTSGILLWYPLLLTISQNGNGNGNGKLFNYLSATYMFFLNPVSFFLNILLALVYATIPDKAPGAPIPVFMMKYFPPTAHAVSFATLLLSTPLSVHTAVAEQSAGLAIGAAMVCLALIAILTSVLMKFLLSQTGGGNTPIALFDLCFSVGFFTLLHSENYHYDDLTNHTPLLLLPLFGCFLLFMLGITQLFISLPVDTQHVETRTKNCIIIAQSVAIATLLILGYLKLYASYIDMAAIVNESGVMIPVLEDCDG